MKIVMIEENYIEFDSGTIISMTHSQDCCENVYADCSALRDYNILPSTGQAITIGDIAFTDDIENCIEQVPDMGFNLISADGSKWFVPCPNEQNGYYSDELTMRIKRDGKTIMMDLTGCTEYTEC